MKATLIGGGYIASNFAERLRNFVTLSEIIQLDLSDGSLDISNPVNFSERKESIDDAFVYIFAAISSDPQVDANMRLACQVNLTGLTNFLEFVMRDCSPLKVIFASSEWVYGETINNGVVDIGRLTSNYARQKVVGEIVTEQLGIAYKVETIITRLGIVWGNRVSGCACEDLALNSVQAAKTGENKIAVGHGGSARRFIHINDLCYALTKISGEPSGIYDLTGDEVVSIKNIVDICGSLLSINFKLEESLPNPSRRFLNQNSIKNVSFPWHKESFEIRMRQHFEEFFF